MGSLKVLVVGSGGREHALCWKLAQSPSVEKIYAAPGNPGMAEIAECINIAPDDLVALSSFAEDKAIDLTVVGPEAPLVAGIVDRFMSAGLRIFGFDSSGSRLEGSKIYAKQFMKKRRIPTAEFRVFDDYHAAAEAVSSLDQPLVVKADGLAAGKGVIVASSRSEAREALELLMKTKEFGRAGERVVIEEFLQGEEISVLAMFDGRSYRLFAASQDHKRAFDGDAGPNTGGMGAYAPVPFFDEALSERVRREIIEPTFSGMVEEGMKGAGVLYFGLMVTQKGPFVLEYNCRFGDPETQVILPLFEGDLAEAMMEAINGRLDSVRFESSRRCAACVVIASGGYPGSYKKGLPIEGLEKAAQLGCIVFHAGTSRKNGTLVASGGRVVGVVGIASDLVEAIGAAYRGASFVNFEGAFYRRDIGRKAVEYISRNRT